MKRKRCFVSISAAAAAAVLHLSSVAAAADFAYELRCEQQYTTAELPDLTWSQGSTPLIAARTYLRGKPVPPREGVTVQMMIAPTATSRWWAVVTNQTTDAASYLLQWPTVGTNTTADAPWYYTVYFLADGHRYWTGSGSLWIEETTATGDGLIWQEITSGDISWVSNRFDAVARDIAGIASDLATNAMQIAELEDAVENRLPGELDRRIDELWGVATGGPLFPRYFSVDGLRTNRVWTYLPSGPEATLGGAIRAVPLNREYVGVLDASDAVATSLVELPEGETPHFADTGTMAWSEGDPFGYGSGTATGFWWRAAGPCTGSWAVAGAGFTNLWSFPPKDPPDSPAWGWTADAAGSLRERANADLDALASRPGRTAEAWSGPGGSWNRDTNFWAAEVDLSCSVQVYWDGTKRVNGRATAVTRRHVVGAHHNHMPAGSALYFYPGDGTRVERTVVDWAKIGTSDVAVGLLDEDLPGEIAPARIVRPEDWALLLPTTDGLPIVGPDGQTGAGKTTVRGPKLDALSVHSLYTRMVWLDPKAGSSGNLNVYTNNASPYSNFATRWGEAAYVTGDSGTPVMLWLDGQTVLALCLWHGNVPHYGDGPSVSAQSAAIEAQIRAWGGTTETNLYWADLSRWSSSGDGDGGEEGEEESP